MRRPSHREVYVWRLGRFAKEPCSCGWCAPPTHAENVVVATCLMAVSVYMLAVLLGLL